eukprot:3407917-Pleurochrysis_carterae.AAC.2
MATGAADVEARPGVAPASPRVPWLRLKSRDGAWSSRSGAHVHAWRRACAMAISPFSRAVPRPCDELVPSRASRVLGL